ncbi:hypothetical protein O181_082664 [Austropuccinia psidii MF-1]|uniref:Uncharacterized protein n=1 Tax=Austropuccinia psidii MF-1 TaxID=1389203 RepID=A0A9Q3IL79_9BASI|nr:hypothetical protein [Austropuccinia psidii MF-1]
MANQTPDSQLSAYEQINRLLSEHCEQSQVVEDDKNISPCILEGMPNTLGDTASQSSQQKRKRRTHEEAQVHRQQVEQERRLKRQKKINERVNAEAQRLRQAEMRLAHQEQQKGRRGRFLWNEESTKALLDLMMELRMDYLNTDFTTSGFIAWSRYFKNNENRKKDFDLLKDLSFETLERHYKALMTTYRMIKDSCDATGGAGLYTQLQRYHMTNEVYDILKQLNMNNCGMNCNGMESGDYTQDQGQENDDLGNENDWNRGGDHERENGQSDTEEDGQPNENAQGSNEEMAQPGPSTFRRNIHGSGRKNRRGSMSQESSISIASTRRDRSFLTNMNNNMQGMLCPLMMMMQQNQERAEERDRRQMERDEERRLQEEQRRVADESRRDRMNMAMLMMFAKVTGVDPASMRDIYGG